MKAKLINTKGELNGEVELPSVFGSKINHELINRSINIYLSNQRASSANTKGRGEVSGSTKKLYKQKGTGNARRGSIRSPLMRGGGVVFGPTSEKNYKRSLSKSQRSMSIRSALSLKAEEGKIYIFELPEMGNDKLSQKAQKFIRTADLGRKALIIQDSFDGSIVKAFNSLENVSVKALSELSVYDIINNGSILLDKGVVENLENRFSLK